MKVSDINRIINSTFYWQEKPYEGYKRLHGCQICYILNDTIDCVATREDRPCSMRYRKHLCYNCIGSPLMVVDAFK